ncbi:hypothetical protein GLYMA_11G134166v4 [Glycine max]|nr:hypothetical protein GLYMA_11G134166v4 [Glycine max]KAH1158989.1 hypothetical protein GYH30_030946 [Glycine max]
MRVYVSFQTLNAEMKPKLPGYCCYCISINHQGSESLPVVSNYPKNRDPFFLDSSESTEFEPCRRFPWQIRPRVYSESLLKSWEILYKTFNHAKPCLHASFVTCHKVLM